jgi:hypothetical protein
MLGRILEEDEGCERRSQRHRPRCRRDRSAADDLGAERMADVEKDPVPEPPETPDSVPGTVYELGPHRLLCGDSTEAATVQKLTAGERVSLLWTDAPYNVAYEGAAGSIMKTTSRGRFRAFLVDAFRACDSVMPPGAVFYLSAPARSERTSAAQNTTLSSLRSFMMAPFGKRHRGHGLTAREKQEPPLAGGGSL